MVLKVEIVEMIEMLDCILSKRATSHIYGSPNTNAYVLMYV